MKLLFIGDIVGPGLDYLEAHLPRLRAQHQPDFIVANAENLELAGARGFVQAGMSLHGLARLWALGVDAVTGGNHSWEGPDGDAVHADPRVLRPLNYGQGAPGQGAALLDKAGLRLGVINLASRDALPLADDPLAALEWQLAAWGDTPHAVLVDMHGASTEEKLTLAYAGAGRVCAVLGTHTHVPTADAGLVAGCVAYVSDVGMTGPTGGILGYQPDKFVAAMRARQHNDAPWQYATGPVTLGAVLVTCAAGRATDVVRVVG
jgi:hypothetical protein